MQGPLVRERSFTLETLRLYRKPSPEPLLVLSTWDNEDTDPIASSPRSCT